MQETVKPRSRWSILKELIKPSDPNKRIEDAYGIMKEVGGFRPLFNVKDLEQRRNEIIQVMTELTKLEVQVAEAEDIDIEERLNRKILVQTYKLTKLFQLFFTTGSPWVRGQDNEQLSEAVACYIENFEDVGDLPGFLPDLHSESIFLLHLAWQGIDVTNTPGYVIQVTNVPGQPVSPRNPNPQPLGDGGQ